MKFLDSETLVSASTDNTLKLWDLKKTSLEGFSLDACSLTFTGHTNEKVSFSMLPSTVDTECGQLVLVSLTTYLCIFQNFVGLSVLDGYIACGSETNEVSFLYFPLF